MYYRLYTDPVRHRGPATVIPEGFAVIACDTQGCLNVAATAFTEADEFPLRLATDAAVAAGWTLLGADDRCPAHRPLGDPHECESCRGGYRPDFEDLYHLDGDDTPAAMAACESLRQPCVRHRCYYWTTR